MRYDLHVHTYLSDCAARDAYPEPFILEAEKRNQTILAFTDHSWDETVEGASPWYKPQTYRRLAEQRKYLHGIPSPVKIIQGAEGEYANFLLGLGEDGAQYADFIAIPHDHVHMKGFVVPLEYDPPELMAKFLLDSMESLCKHPNRHLFMALCHPFNAICRTYEYQREVWKYITNSMVEEALDAAKEADLLLEFNLSSFQDMTVEEIADFPYTRFFHMAKENGNILYWGSDAHSIGAYRSLHDRADEIMKAAGLCESDFDEAEKRILAL